MKDLKIKARTDIFQSPEVNFNAKTGICELRGESYLEETFKFYGAILDWVREFVQLEKGSLVLEVKLTYFNSTSSKSIADLLALLKEYQDAGGQVEVNWYYELGYKDSMEEEVEDFEDETGMSINFLPLNSGLSSHEFGSFED